MQELNAIDYLMKKLKPYLKVDALSKPIIDFHSRRANARQRQQIIDAYKTGFASSHFTPNESAEDYFKQTFKQ
jgi:hypothetical protein